MTENSCDTETATVGGGCFWCVEAVFQQLEGVVEVVSGYSGGDEADPSYDLVCSGTTEHAEVVQVKYDPGLISYRELLEVFFTTHDPTQKNRQGPDVGPQYRSIVFYHDENQRELVRTVIDELESSGDYEDKIVTEVEPFESFYEAESYHQDYYEKNPNQIYCRTQIPPKLEKLHSKHSDKTTPE